MKVRVRLYASFRRYLGDLQAGTPVEIELPEGSTLRDLAQVLKLPVDEVKVCFINGIISELDQPLHENEEVGMFPPIGGG